MDSDSEYIVPKELARRFEFPELSDWECYLFGGTGANSVITWRPNKGAEPNWFWRWMQYICFGNHWHRVS